MAGFSFKQSGWISLPEKVRDKNKYFKVERESGDTGTWGRQRRQHRDIKEGSSIVPKMVKVLHFVDVLSKYWEKRARKHWPAQHRVWQKESKGMAFPFDSHGECVLCRVRKNWTRHSTELVFGPQQLLIPQADRNLLVHNSTHCFVYWTFQCFRNSFLCMVIHLFSKRGRENFLQAFVIPHSTGTQSRTGLRGYIRLQVNLVERHWEGPLTGDVIIAGKCSGLRCTVSILPF